MSTNYEKLKELLKTLFQLDQSEDLDFGIYRIMNQKREEITRFLDRDLLPQVREALKQHQSGEQERIKEELDQLIQRARDMGVDPDSVPKVRELRAKFGQAADLEALEGEVYSALYNFFNRYYHEGDFLSKRRYKEGVYAIPYEGEEVKLHWANADQYYIKTTEHFRDFTFKLPSGKRVQFKLVEATTEKDNNKPQNGNERYFVLSEREPIREEDGMLVIPFEYRSLEEKKSQDQLNKKAAEKIFATQGIADWLRELSEPRPTEKDKKRTLLDRQLARYTKRNKYDYFIHKDLGGFLRRELDFYIKNEIMHLDDLNTENEHRLEQYLSKIKVIKKIGHKIIAFLEQIENFQKKLWLKKKFVVRADYCVTLDRVPEELYPEIVRNEAQIEEWKRLFAIHEIEGDLTTVPYSEPLTVEFLKAHPYLVLDTKFFDEEFKERLLASFDDLDEATDGLLIHSENFQALRLLLERYREQVKCIYIDPPYNSKTSEILYKNTYKHSSWLSLMSDRIALASHLLQSDSVFVCAIDENEQERLGMMLERLFPDAERTCVTVVHNPRGIQGKGFSYSHEFAYFVHRPGLSLGLRSLDSSKAKPLMKTGFESERETARNCFYPIYVKDDRVVRIGDVPKDDWHPESPIRVLESGEIEIWPISITDRKERKWRYARQSIEAVFDQLEVREGRDGLPVIYLKKNQESYRTVWTDAVFNAAEYGSTLLKNIVSDADFSFPKSVWTVYHSLKVSNVNNGDITVDFFAGSGTTAHAVINLNREDGGRRKYILVEMGDYFDTVLKPRIQKVIYSKDWKDGKPVSRQGSSHMFKYMRLESYEDTLNNLELKRDDALGDLLKENRDVREEYLLSYMLDIETRGSASLLNLDRFSDPFNYRLKIAEGDETRETVIDLVETFNYLIGLKVERMGPRETFIVEDDPRSDVPGAVRLKKNRDGEITFREVEGVTRDGQKVLIIWRTLTGDIRKDNAALDAYFAKRDYNTRDFEFDRIYVNGDNNLENLKIEGGRWKVTLIEEEFHRRMFDVQDV